MNHAFCFASVIAKFRYTDTDTGPTRTRTRTDPHGPNGVSPQKVRVGVRVRVVEFSYKQAADSLGGCVYARREENEPSFPGRLLFERCDSTAKKNLADREKTTRQNDSAPLSFRRPRFVRPLKRLSRHSRRQRTSPTKRDCCSHGKNDVAALCRGTSASRGTEEESGRLYGA